MYDRGDIMAHKKKNGPLDEKIDINRSDVLYSMLYGGSHIEMFGNNKMIFEGRYKILEYTEDILKIRLNKNNVNIIGTELSISNVENGSFMLTGIISDISFE